MQAMHSVQTGVIGGIGGQMEGLDIDSSCFAMGQSAGGVHDILPAGEIVARILAEADTAIDRMNALRSRVSA
jgi:enoyl-[acyl-carrier protein] reductase II